MTFKEKLAEILRPAFGYKYKVVYTELEINASFKKRYMAKIKADESPSKILRGLPKVKGNGYVTPVTLYWSKTDTHLNERVVLKQKDHPFVVFKAFFS
jgi:hypothetical protein